MADYPTDLSAVTDNVDDVLAKYINNLETRLGIKNSAVPDTIDYLLHANPQGFGTNYKIVPSVASDILTVEIKGMDGNDPSTTNPVYITINSITRSITGALSVIADAGSSSYLNMGSTSLAGKEVDLFLYLCYNSNTTSVTAIFSRIPYANLISEFTDSLTGEKGYIYNGTKPASTDSVVLIGRFAATLSAPAALQWSVPTFTPINLIQRPIYESRRLEWTPANTFSGGTADPLELGELSSYQVVGRNLLIRKYLMSSDPGTGARTTLLSTVPFTSKSGYRVGIAAANLNGSTVTHGWGFQAASTIYSYGLSMSDNVAWEYYIGVTIDI
jgi:hypothetical protein